MPLKWLILTTLLATYAFSDDSDTRKHITQKEFEAAFHAGFMQGFETEKVSSHPDASPVPTVSPLRPGGPNVGARVDPPKEER
jgi:hypothetical protein